MLHTRKICFRFYFLLHKRRFLNVWVYTLKSDLLGYKELKKHKLNAKKLKDLLALRKSLTVKLNTKTLAGVLKLFLLLYIPKTKMHRRAPDIPKNVRVIVWRKGQRSVDGSEFNSCIISDSFCDIRLDFRLSSILFCIMIFEAVKSIIKNEKYFF